MYFNTLEYFVFFLIVYLAVRYATRFGLIGVVLIGASAVFYAVAGIFDSLLIASMIALNWMLIKYIRPDRLRVVLAVLFNIGALAWIKYRAFFMGASIADGTAYIDTILPLGISFYTFQLLAFQVDAKDNPGLKKTEGLIFPLFVGFFPQLIAGPIVRAKELFGQLKNILAGRPRKLRLLSFGLGLCLLGLTKKVMLADSLAPVVDDIFYLQSPSTFDAWLGAWLFTFQIYFDFSGYSDIALGCAYLLGIRLPWNFRTPYMSRSPREFWQRWHITLSTWIRDYLYIPLGGNKGGVIRQVVTVLVVMGLAGLWHGADHTFIIWGLGWGLYIVLARAFGGLRTESAAPYSRPLLWSCHLLVVVVLWVFFRAPNLEVAAKFLHAMFVNTGSGLPTDSAMILLGCGSLMLLHFAEAHFLQSKAQILRLRRVNNPFFHALFIGLCLWLVILPSYDVNPFIYFRF
ncbi:MAG: MBOAT family O-acyltransferase [Gammaproteobacteria bacterium]